MASPLHGVPSPESPFQRRDAGSRRSTWSSFGVSVAVHAVVLLGAAFGLSLPARPGNPRVGAVTPIEPEPDIVWIIGDPPPPQAPPREDVPEAPSTGPVPQVALVRPTLGDTGGDRGAEIALPSLPSGGPPGGTRAERLQPALTDPRIWAPLPPEFRTLTPAQREELLIAGRLSAWNDSVAATAAAGAAWRDWTYTDGDGDRWGVADGQLFLGDVVIPFPMTFSGGAGDRAYMRDFAEMQRQGANALIQQSVRERQDAIRARRDRERAEQARADSARTTPR